MQTLGNLKDIYKKKKKELKAIQELKIKHLPRLKVRIQYLCTTKGAQTFSLITNIKVSDFSAKKRKNCHINIYPTVHVLWGWENETLSDPREIQPV